MSKTDPILELTETLNRRLDAIEAKLDVMRGASKKGLEWIGMLSEHIESLDEFRDEVRASIEPLSNKLENLDDVMRILRHATVDVSRRVENLESDESTHRRTA